MSREIYSEFFKAITGLQLCCVATKRAGVLGAGEFAHTNLRFAPMRHTVFLRIERPHHHRLPGLSFRSAISPISGCFRSFTASRFRSRRRLRRRRGHCPLFQAALVSASLMLAVATFLNIHGCHHAARIRRQDRLPTTSCPPPFPGDVLQHRWATILRERRARSPTPCCASGADVVDIMEAEPVLAAYCHGFSSSIPIASAAVRATPAIRSCCPNVRFVGSKRSTTIGTLCEAAAGVGFDRLRRERLSISPFPHLTKPYFDDFHV